MRHSPPRERKRRGYGLFVFAAAVYSAGVLAFSIWAYFQHRTNVLAQIDGALVDATYATEQILGKIFIQCAVETGKLQELGRAENKENLEQFAAACGFNSLGVATRNQNNVISLVTDPAPSYKTRFQPHEPINYAAIIHQLAQSKTGNLLVQNLHNPNQATLRVAVRYKALTESTGYALMVAQDMAYVNALMRPLAIRTVANGIFLHLMAFPLIVLYARARLKSAKKLSELNKRLQQDVAKRSDRESELEDAIHDLERFNALVIGREGRIIELKAEVNTLLVQMKREKRYNVDHAE